MKGDDKAKDPNAQLVDRMLRDARSGKLSRRELMQGMLALGITGLVVGFYRFIREAMALNREQTRSSSRTDGDPNT